MEDLFQSQKPNLEEEIKPSRAVSFWQLGGGLFVLLIFLLGIFVWHSRYTKDSLLTYAPIDTAVYLSARNSFWPWENIVINDLPLAHVFSYPELLDLSSHAALLKIPSRDDQFETVQIFYLKHIEQAVPIIENLEFTTALDKHVVVVADNQEVLNKIKEVQRGTIFSLASQLENRKIGRGLLNLYIDSGNLKSQFKKSSALPDQLVNYLSSTDLYLSLNKEKDVWVFASTDELNLSSGSLASTLQFLPGNFDVFISQVNLIDIFSNFAFADQVFAQDSSQIIANLEAIYSFDFKSTILPLLDRKAEVVVLNSGTDSALGFDYVLVLPQASDEQVQGFEELIRIILSQKLPKEAFRQLPDGSFVIELMADTNSWSWEENDQGQKILTEPKLNFEVVYQIRDGDLIIGSSADLLNQVLQAQEVSLANLAKRCSSGFSSPDFLLINSDIKISFSDILPAGLTVFSTSPENSLTGCIF